MLLHPEGNPRVNPGAKPPDPSGHRNQAQHLENQALGRVGHLSSPEMSKLKDMRDDFIYLSFPEKLGFSFPLISSEGPLYVVSASLNSPIYAHKEAGTK